MATQRFGAIPASRLNNEATTAPTVSDDSNAGYAIGSEWIDTTADKVYKCVDATVGAAVWKDLTAAVSASEAFKVGSIYINITGTDPATELGYGTWTAFGAGRTLVGRDAGDTDFDTAEETGGAKTVAAAGSNAAEAAHTHSVTSNVAVGNHTVTQPTIAWPAGVPTAANESAHTHTYTQVPNHVHVERAQGGTTASTTGTHLMTSAATGGSLRSSAQSTLDPTGGVATGTTNAGSAHTHTLSWPAGVPTASGAATDAHSVTNNAVTSGAGSSHNHAFTGTPTSVVQPYIVVYMWKRTA